MGAIVRPAAGPDGGRAAAAPDTRPAAEADVEAALRERLVVLYAALSALTEPECAAACRRPLSCCEAMYCGITMDFAREAWGVELSPTWHAALPLMGPHGCTVAPHLRPICTAHTCAVSEEGCKPGDADWTARYNSIRDEIGAIESMLFPVLSIR